METMGITVRIVRHSRGDRARGRIDRPPSSVPRFELVPRRWVAERLFAWLGKYRRLSKDYEYDVDALNNTIHSVMIMVLLHRLCEPFV